MSYQGHMSDGSSIQKHSVGPIFPFVIAKYERPSKPWVVMSPDGSECPWDTFSQAFETAEYMLYQYKAKKWNM